ncbi:uncharacterized protein N7525_001066, partial [Penicillium rubens]|uniref:uncharacterized protein n=1 Tax=Penicillium rubens TaxID=1108849 RepID=UPI002A59BAA0
QGPATQPNLRPCVTSLSFRSFLSAFNAALIRTHATVRWWAQQSVSSILLCELLQTAIFCYPLSIFCGCGCTQAGKEYALLSFYFLTSRLTISSMLAYPVKLNRKVSNAIPI